MRQSTQKTYDPAADDTDSRSRAQGMLELLLSAQALARRHQVDKTGLAWLEKCAERLRAVHELAPPKIPDDSHWAESSLPGLLRLLVYLHAEAADGLGDDICALFLQRCITELIRAHRLSPDNLCDGQGDTCH